MLPSESALDGRDEQCSDQRIHEQPAGACRIWTISAMQRCSSRLRADLLAQKYGPPDEGREDTISAMARPTDMVTLVTNTQPHTVGTGPPLLKASPKDPVIPVRMLMMLHQAPSCQQACAAA